MANWLFKTEPGDYSYADLERDGRTCWDGVKNNWALKNLREVRQGDRVLIYHTGKDKPVVGEARVISDPHPDPERDDPHLVVVDVEPVRALPRPVTLAEIKSDPKFADFGLVRFSRLAEIAVPPLLWKRLSKMADKTD